MAVCGNINKKNKKKKQVNATVSKDYICKFDF